MNELQKIRTELITEVTPSRLKDITIALIAHFKRKDIRSITVYAQRAGIDAQQLGLNKTFSSLMHLYHPDRFAAIIRDIDAHIESGDSSMLNRMKALYVFTDPLRPMHYAQPDEEIKEEYGFAEDDFGWQEKKPETASRDTEDYEPAEQDSEYEYTFTEAVNRHFYGNLDEAVTLSDMKNLDGELDLSGYAVSELTGIEHCINLTSLNLSGNRIISISRLRFLESLEILYLSENSIESIAALQNLSSLRELDLSFNCIDDFTVLLSMESLEYVNLAGNPHIDAAVVKKLHDKGVMVIS